jgi:hypothetical protein
MRRRRPFFLAVGLLLAAAGATFGVLLYFVKSEPKFYTAARTEPADWETHERAAKLLTRVQELQNDIRAKGEWGDTFTEEDLNCFFAENLGPKDGLTGLLPKGFHSPRVSIEGDRLRLGVKYRDGFWSTVVWLEMRVWLVAEQVNVAAVEVCELRAGGLPFGSQSILDKISDVARDAGIEVTWHRHGSNPVGLFKFFPKQTQQISQVLTLEVNDGKIVVAGKSSQYTPPATPLGVTPQP